MAKRHHSMKDMESKGRYKGASDHHKAESRSGYASGYYEGPEERRAQERQDGSMLSNDYNAIANLPQEPKMMLYERLPYAKSSELDDRLSGIDHQMRDDESMSKDERYPDKY